MSTIEIPGYRILRELGKGGMATVYLAIQESFQREVALKVMASSLTESETFSQRFLQEARIVSRLMHPNIVSVHDVGVHEGHHYLSMQYIAGQDLMAAQPSLTGKQIKRLLIDIAEAIHYAGEKGYVHRDVKPENIMLHHDTGRALLMDFGIARTLDGANSMTVTGTALGTPYYMSPEQAQGLAVDTRADLYSLGVVFYFLLIGKVPYFADTPVAIGIKHITEAIPALPEALAVYQPLLNQLMAKKLEERFQTGAEFAEAIGQLDVVAIDAWCAARPARSLVVEAVPDSVPPVSKLQTLSREGMPLADDPNANTQPLDELPSDTLSDEGAFAKTTPLPAVKNLEQYQQVKKEALAFEKNLRVEKEDALEREQAQGVNNSKKLAWLIVPVLLAGAAAGIWLQQKIPPPGPQTSPPQEAVLSDESNASLEQKTAVVEESLQADALLNEAIDPLQTASNTAATDALVEEPVDDILDESNSPVLATSTVQSPDGIAGDNLVNDEKLEQASLESVDDSVVEQSPLAKALAQAQLLQAGLSAGASPAEVVEAYQHVLALELDNAQALQGLDQVFEEQVLLAENALHDGDVEIAQPVIAQLEEWFPLRIEQAQLQALKSSLDVQLQIKSLLAEGDEAIEAGRYLTPEQTSAYTAFNQVLELQEGSPEALKGIDRIAERYLSLAKQEQSKQRYQKALDFTEKGLSVQGGDRALLAIKDTLVLQYQREQNLQQLARQALVAESEQRWFEGIDSAASYYQGMLAIAPDSSVAKKGLAGLAEQLQGQVQEQLAANQLEQAQQLLAPALALFPEESVYLALQQLIADAKPAIDQIRVSGVPIDEVDTFESASIQVGRTLHITLKYKNFHKSATVLQVLLLDGARSVQIAAVPVIITGNSGVNSFRIDRPVEGFTEGGYHIDVLLSGDKMVSKSFVIGP